MAGAFCGNIDLSKIDKADFVANNDFVWVKSEVLEKIYKIDDAFHTVIIFNNGCFATQCQLDQRIGDALLWVAINVMAAQGDLFGNVTVPSGVAVNICGVPDQDKFNKALTAVDVNAVNQFGFQPAAIMPSIAAIPLRSNIKIYGPYPSANFGLCGGATVESDPDLCPWVFGSAALMDAAGQAKANSMNVTPLSIAETGTITIPEMPSSNLGSQLGNGPNLTGINVSFGSSGVTSTYSYQTYTPKPGGFTRLFIDRLKNVAKYRQQQIKFLRNNAIDLNKINRRLRVIRGFNQQNNNLARQRANQPTAERVLVGEIYDFHPDTSGQRTVVAATTLPKAIQEMRYDFEKKAYMSLDGLYGPVSVNGDGGLPQYAKYSGSGPQPPCHKASPTLPYAPFATGNNLSVDGMDMSNYNLEIYQRGLNPVTNPGDNPNASDSDGQNSGHVIDMLGRSSGSLDDGFIMNFYLGQNAGQQYEQDYRFLGMRGPLLLHSWGYDTQGKPIPNEADTDDDAKTGIFKNTNNKDKFLKDWLQKPSTWPVAPVDLRFDRDRGLWVSPPSYKIVVAKLEEKLEAYGKAKAFIITKNTEKNQSYGRPLINADGQEVKSQDDESDAKIVVVDRIGQSFPKDSLLYVYYDTHTCEYIILVGQPETSSIIRFKLIDICPSLASPPVDNNWGDAWLAENGYGDKFFDNNSFTDSYAVRLNCNGEPVTKDGTVLTDINPGTIKDDLIIVRDVVGKWGPSFNRYTNFSTWMQRAAEGYGVKIPQPSGSGEGSSSSEECDLRTPCLITYTGPTGEILTVDEQYDILFLESYARFIHGCLEQDLYPVSGEEDKYSGDTWKSAHPSGNAIIKVEKFYGNADNGREPYYLNSSLEEIKTRVFDPWVSSEGEPLSCYDPKKYQMYSAKSGTPVVAVFNEKVKRYEIIEVAQEQAKLAVRFRLYGCKQLEASTPSWPDGDDWTEVAGFFDKKPNGHSLAIRIDCDGNAVNRKGELLQANDIDINSPDKKDIFINVFDTAGKWGPSFAGYLNFEHWTNNASAGFGLVCDIPPSGCSMGVSPDCNQIDPDLDSYDIVYLESYARYIHGCLEQDLYISQEKANEKYPDDTWKLSHPSGNSAVTVLKYYGNADNGQEPKIYDNNGNDDTIPIRVFDPWVDSNGDPISCYKPEDGPYYSAKSGTAFTAILNEKTKRYELIQVASSQKEDNIVRFRLIDYCYGSGNGQNNTDPYAAGDTWMQYAGFNDKFTNSHSVAIKINCDGVPVDKNNEIVTALDIEQAIIDPNGEVAKRIFINVYDTVGRFGPSFNAYIIYGNPDLNYNQWIENAATGFATQYSSNPSGLSCNMGRTGDQCLDVNADYKSYEIIFLESYARFIECVLDQDMYPSYSQLSNYSNDPYKVNNPYGNASATIYDNKFYGDSPNGRFPKFYDINGAEVPLRVFDPFISDDPQKNPFYDLKEGDRVLCVFNDKLKKYVIYNSLKNQESEVVKFALVQDKGAADETVQAILVNQNNEPITIDGKELIGDQIAFNNNIIIVRDPFSDDANLKSRFGPALGSSLLDEHINGINLNVDCYNEPIFPFIGYALKRYAPVDEYGTLALTYEIITLEHYAKTIRGKVASITPVFSFDGGNYYYGFRTYHNDGVAPIARGTASYGVPNVLLDYDVLNFNGAHSYIVGRVVDGDYNCEAKIDGCNFKAILDPSASSTTHLVYRITEAEHLALTGVTIIKKIDLANQLNDEKIKESTDNTEIISEYFQGFIWDKNKSQELYEDIDIVNNPLWEDLPKITTNSRLHTTIIGITPNGAPRYRIVNADTIADLGVRWLDAVSEPGAFGHPGFPENDRRVDVDTDGYCQGVTPEFIDVGNEKPLWKLSPNPDIENVPTQEWMTFKNGRVLGLWVDRGGPNIKDGYYLIAHAQEAPVIITCLASTEFKPTDANDIIVGPILSSSQGYNDEPLEGGGNLLSKVENPMGYGAKIGDHVTIQRVWTGVIANGANYKYIVIGTGSPPGPLKN